MTCFVSWRILSGMKKFILLFAFFASPAFADDHWAHGCWPTGSWGGVCIRPDGYVTESDPDGNLTDVGRWWRLGDDDIFWVFACSPYQTYCLRRDGFYEILFGGDYWADCRYIKKGHVPDFYEPLWISP